VIRGLIALAVVAGIVVGCSPAISRDPKAPQGWPLELSFDGRGNAPVILRINGVDVAHLPCLQGETRTFGPGTGSVPALPWNLQVIRERDGQVLLNADVSSLPKFIVAFPDDVGIGSNPALGPAPPTCAPA
jgi:hypothetical protein